MHQLSKRPTVSEMERAFYGRDASYDGVFFVGVRTTGVFCRPSCAARKPFAHNVQFFANTGDAVAEGYRPPNCPAARRRAGSAGSWSESSATRRRA
jgi:AraC family transcriptional regulator of adaptative response/methylated-DNA-[protein]-cysteine methyltransferase